MNMRMELELAPPGVEHAQEAQLGPQIFIAPGHVLQRPGAFFEQRAVTHLLVRAQPGSQPLGHGEGDEVVRNGQEYMRSIARVACTRGELDRAMTELGKLTDPAGRRAFAGNAVLPVRTWLTKDWGRMMTLGLETADTWGSIGHVFTHEMFNRGTLALLEGHDAAITKALGTDLPEAARASKAYEGKPRLIVPSRRSVAEAGEALTLRVIVLDNAPPRSAMLRWRPLGRGEWQSLPLKRVARAVHSVTLPPAAGESI